MSPRLAHLSRDRSTESLCGDPVSAADGSLVRVVGWQPGPRDLNKIEDACPECKTIAEEILRGVA